MIAVERLSSWLVYRYLGLKFVSRSWFQFWILLGPSA